MSRYRSRIELARTVLAETRHRQISFLAAAIAFYGFVSIVPLLLLAIAVGSAVGLPIGRVTLDLTEQVLTPSAQGSLLDAVSVGANASSVTALGLLVLAWSGLKVFRALDVAFAAVYGTAGAQPFLGTVRDAVLVFLTMPVGIVLAAAIGVVFPLVVPGVLAEILRPFLLVGVLIPVFLPMYVLFPDVPTTPREALSGAVVAASGWSVLAVFGGAFVESMGSYPTYGVLGGGLLLVTSMYLGGIIIMVGGVVHAVLAGHSDDGNGRTESVDSGGQAEAPEIEELSREVSSLREDLEEKTVSRSELEADLERYVRRRMRRGKAHGWGPYLVLLYGTVMTLGAFYWLGGGWAILAMLVVWLSTLGLYVLLVLFGIGIEAVGVPGRALDWLRERRS
ncbi:MAG: YihY/virulence factor BrkB family protein [Halodesulfurarchaeum sp.]